MEKCTEFSTDEILNDGIVMFTALSSIYFEHVAKDIGFSGKYIVELKSIARQFSETAYPLVGISTPSNQSQDQFIDLNLLASTWENTYIQLERLGIGKDVCQWMQYVKIERAKFSKYVTNLGWQALLVDWSLGKIPSTKLQLPPLKIAEIQLMVLRGLLENQWWDHNMRQTFRKEDLDKWETYIVNKRKTLDWITRTRSLRVWVLQWHKMLYKLNDVEITLLNDWVKEIGGDQSYDVSELDLLTLVRELDNHRKLYLN